MAYEKICPICKAKSYGSTLKGKWICPKYNADGKPYGCGADITYIPATDDADGSINIIIPPENVDNDVYIPKYDVIE